MNRTMKNIGSASAARRGSRAALASVIAVAVAILAGCSDRGSEILRVEEPPPPVPGPVPVLAALVPARTIVGDTVRIAGTGFGDQGTRVVLFPASPGGTVPAAVITWTADTLSVLVPAGSGRGDVVVQDGDSTSNGLAFETAPRAVSYSDVNQVFSANCVVCHAPPLSTQLNGGLDLTTLAGLMAGGSVPPGIVVLPRHSAESALVQRINPSGEPGYRMPQWSPPLSDSLVLLISDWIDQGARP